MLHSRPEYRSIDLAGAAFAYLDAGEGEPVLLIHGFASTAAVNWLETGWIESIVRSGRRAIAPDSRGHGRSRKFYQPADYVLESMAKDAVDLLAALQLDRADVVGYSMGARIGAAMALLHADKVRSLVLGGVAGGLITGTRDAETVAKALEAPALSDVTDATGRMFRQFAERTGSDLRALAACMRARGEGIAPERLKRLTMPVLIAVGTEDEVAGPPAALAGHIPGASVLDLPGRDHMKAVGDPAFKRGVLEFLAGRP